MSATRRANNTLSPRRAQRGSGLVIALFVLVAGAAIAAALTPLLADGSQSNELVIAHARAAAAADSALEWARYRIDRQGVCAGGTLVLHEAALAGARATVDCALSTHDDGGVPRRVYAIRVFAQYGRFGGPGYASATRAIELVR
ncbi:MAG: hypothetical protein RML32_09375 [Gammaproteobacteria bacterium]|nr:hypothetical protein [Gammaproteobacteria bacterium]